ncbi:MAG TPA: isocitrate lyase/phosphoenolpyruvate mutase family protein [Burkholderiales bacterium]|nr:isocitrate lyase/phosphoenolpyruvate mutase family protein [Burkholderiales bacterium]
MDIANQKRKAEAFRRLHERHRGSRMLLLPNAWDAMSARLFEQAGFTAIATTSGGVSWALGYPDGEQAPRDEVIAATARIARVVDCPVTADLEAGFGDTPDAVAETVAQAIHAGVVGINLEDGTHRADAPVRDSDAMAARIHAAREAARAAGVPIMINARTDLYLLRIGGERERFDEAIRRARVYLDGGADCFFPIGLTDAQTIAALVKALDAPVNIALMHDAPAATELERLGVARVSTAIGPVCAVMGLVQQAAVQLHETGRFDSPVTPFTHPDAQVLFAKA